MELAEAQTNASSSFARFSAYICALSHFRCSPFPWTNSRTISIYIYIDILCVCVYIYEIAEYATKQLLRERI